MMNARLAVLLATASSLLACGPAQGPASGPVKAAPAPDAPQVIKTRVDEIASAKVYDAAGRAAACAPPIAACPAVTPDRAFLDRCRLAGFQVRTCGCDALCSGDVSKVRPHYDLANNAKECAPRAAACEPPAPSAALQDACAEKGHRLEVCGCEWLCSGKLR